MPSDTDWTPTAQVTRSRRGSVRCRYTATRSQTPRSLGRRGRREANMVARIGTWEGDRKSTRLNSSHGYISYAVFCLKKKKTKKKKRDTYKKSRRKQDIKQYSI